MNTSTVSLAMLLSPETTIYFALLRKLMMNIRQQERDEPVILSAAKNPAVPGGFFAALRMTGPVLIVAIHYQRDGRRVVAAGLTQEPVRAIIVGRVSVEEKVAFL